MSWNETDRKSFNLNTEHNATLGLDWLAMPGRSTVGFIFCVVPSDSDSSMSSIIQEKMIKDMPKYLFLQKYGKDYEKSARILENILENISQS